MKSSLGSQLRVRGARPVVSMRLGVGGGAALLMALSACDPVQSSGELINECGAPISVHVTYIPEGQIGTEFDPNVYRSSSSLLEAGARKPLQAINNSGAFEIVVFGAGTDAELYLLTFSAGSPAASLTIAGDMCP